MTYTKRKRNTEPGILYVILVELEGKPLVKIGVTHRTIEDRVSEILVGIFKKYREFPYCRPKRFKKTTDIYGKEKSLHKHFESHRYTPKKKFGGSTEFFDIPLETVVKMYDDIVTPIKPKKKGVFFAARKIT